MGAAGSIGGEGGIHETGFLVRTEDVLLPLGSESFFDVLFRTSREDRAAGRARHEQKRGLATDQLR